MPADKLKTINTMEVKEFYVSPRSEIVPVQPEGIVCASKDEYVPQEF